MISYLIVFSHDQDGDDIGNDHIVMQPVLFIMFDATDGTVYCLNVNWHLL